MLFEINGNEYPLNRKKGKRFILKGGTSRTTHFLAKPAKTPTKYIKDTKTSK